MRLLALAALACSSVAVAGSSPRDIAMFPKPAAGMQRHVIRLPARIDEAMWQVELRAGMVKQVDCNHQNMGENLVEKDLQGWGYSYWDVMQTRTVSTMMGCPPGSAHMAFVSGSSETMRYNSRLPIIIYAPKGYDVRYRLWSVASPEWQAHKG